MRNYPEWITTFQAIQTLGAISAVVNAWSPAETIVHCLMNSDSKIAIMDEERAKGLAGFKGAMVKNGCNAFFVVKKNVPGFEGLETALSQCRAATPPTATILPDVSCVSSPFENTIFLIHFIFTRSGSSLHFLH